jgi:formate dehydrogenase subunit gamma
MSELRIPGATPVSGPTAMQVGRDREDVMVGDELVRHKLGVAFAAATLVMVVLWIGQMRFDAGDKRFNVIEYLRFSDREDSEVGKYNAGQKFFFWMVLVTMLLLLLTGIVLWWPNYFGQGLRSASILLHDICFIGFFMAIVGHIYLGTAAEPGTFRSMTRGTVTRPWARLHHPRWYREVTGDRR